MRTPIAWRNLTHRKTRAAVALCGICFSVLLVFMQAGFHAAVLSSATAVYRAMDADIFITSPLYVFLGRTGTIPRQRLFQVQGAAGVRAVTSFFADTQAWRNPQTRLRHSMLVMGIDPTRNIFRVPRELASQMDNGRILLDSLSRPEYGPQDVGVVTEIGELQVRIAGKYRIGPGFATEGAAMVDDDTFIRLVPGSSIEKPSMGIVQLDSTADPKLVAETLRRILPEDSNVFTRAEMIDREERYWAEQTSIGPVFAAGGVLGLVIGIVVLYQVMVSDLMTHLREYATMKALGYNTARLRWIVLQEVSAFSIGGFVIGSLLSAQLHKIVRDATGLPMSMPLSRVAGVFVLTLLMCWTAGLLSTRRLRRADPADLF
jgi:putative ABC transport system permease protein